MFAYDNPALVTDQSAVMRYAGIPSSVMPNTTVPSLPASIPQDLDISTLSPIPALTPPNATRSTTLFVTFEVDSSSNFRAFFNSSSWMPEMNGNATVLQTAEAAVMGNSWSGNDQLIVTNDGIEVFDLVINNQDDGDHPYVYPSLPCLASLPPTHLTPPLLSSPPGAPSHSFHLHGHTPYLLGTGAGNYLPSVSSSTLETQNPMRRDVFVVPAYSWGVVRFVTDNPGLWAM